MSALILLVFFTHRVGVRKTGSANGIVFAKQAPLMGLISQTGGPPPFGVAHGVGVRKYGIATYSKRAAGTELKILPSGMGCLEKLVSLKHWHWPESSGETPDQRKVYVYGSAGNRSVSCRLASDFCHPAPPLALVWNYRLLAAKETGRCPD